MGRALELAALGHGRTAPNPPVGAVVVRDERIVGESQHVAAGEAHAEMIALVEAGSLARDATLYVTLEPCCHHGRTPPCTDAIIAAGIVEVRYALKDPDPRVAGGGHQPSWRPGFGSRSVRRRGRRRSSCGATWRADGSVVPGSRRNTR